MVTITEAIQYSIKQHSDQIHRLKSEGVTREVLEKVAYVSNDGKSFIDRRHSKKGKAAGWKLGRVRYEKVTGFMSPRHPRWREYLAARHRASLLLTARMILKLGGESVPSFSTVLHSLSQGGLREHARRGRERRLCIDAYRYLRKLNNRIERAPETFGPVAEWLAVARSAASSGRERIDA